MNAGLPLRVTHRLGGGLVQAEERRVQEQVVGLHLVETAGGPATSGMV
jgi:hypothetical protein